MGFLVLKEWRELGGVAGPATLLVKVMLVLICSFLELPISLVTVVLHFLWFILTELLVFMTCRRARHRMRFVRAPVCLPGARPSHLGKVATKRCDDLRMAAVVAQYVHTAIALVQGCRYGDSRPKITYE